MLMKEKQEKYFSLREKFIAELIEKLDQDGFRMKEASLRKALRKQHTEGQIF